MSGKYNIFFFTMVRETLKIMTLVDGKDDVPFHDAANPIEITEYTYTSSRMGSVSLTATLMYPECLDDEWNGRQYVDFRGERYFVSATPSSSKDNEDERYRHELNFIPDRDIKLNNVYFYDAVSEESTEGDRFRSNSTKVVFFGDIREFAARLGESLAYSGVGYTVTVDDGVESEPELMSFKDQFFFNVLQQMYETYGIPFYFSGTVIHIGYAANAVVKTFRYGSDNELLSVSKNNANYRTITRCSGTGSGDNIPYYYPNRTAKGDISAKAGTGNTGVLQDDITITDADLFTRSFDLVTPLVYEEAVISGMQSFKYIHDGYRRLNPDNIPYVPYTPGEEFDIVYGLDPGAWTRAIYIKVSGHADSPGTGVLRISFGYRWTGGGYAATLESEVLPDDIRAVGCSIAGISGSRVSLKFEEETDFSITLTCCLRLKISYWAHDGADTAAEFAVSYTPKWEDSGAWTYGGKEIGSPGDVGLSIGDAVPHSGDTIMQVQEKYITPSSVLLPPVYRETDGAERFYNALNNTYTDPDTGEYYVFGNEFVKDAPKEHIEDFPDIKPTITGIRNAAGQRFDTILEVAFDTNDDDQTDEEGNYLHPYFFARLPKFDGEYGFNLFDSQIDEEEMSVSMKSGACGACEFVIGVSDDDTQANLVQVDEDGNLLRDSEGNVRCGREGMPQETPQAGQNDTRNNEVWVALKKDTSTYGQIMPNAGQNLRPAAGDTFVILHILLPEQYILNAENELKEAVIRFMSENNGEKFNFSIAFSRIYLAENPDVAAQINENATLRVEYNGKTIELYVSRFTYRCIDEEALPEIQVELNETVTVNRTTLQNVADSVAADIRSGIANMDILRMGLRYFLRKDTDDESRGVPSFMNGVRFGKFSSGLLGTGGAVTVDEDNGTHMEIDYLNVRKRADFSAISIQELKQIGGQFVVSPASIVCTEVEKTENGWICRFDTGESGSQSLNNQFVPGDQARMQTFNQLGSRYYWRLVTAIGEDWIELSETDCDEGSGEPEPGDNIVQMGNRNDPSRQSAQVLSCFGENAPSFIIYNGINSYDLTGKNIAGIIYNPETKEPQMYCYGPMFLGDRDIEQEDANYITFQQKSGDSKKKLYISADIHIGPGSSGLSNLEEWAETQKTIETAGQKADDLQYLKEIFQKPTLDSEGAILAKFLAVKDDNGNIVAGLNASYEVGESPTTDAHGRLLIFGGSQNLEDVSQADTRIYEDGTIYTTLLNALGGYIGNWNITDGDYLKSYNRRTTGLGTFTMMTTLRYSGMAVTASKHLLVGPRRFQTVVISPMNGIKPDSDAGLSYSPQDLCAVMIQSSDNSSSDVTAENVGLYVDVFGHHDNEKNIAIYANRGTFAGLRPTTRTVRSDVILDTTDHTIMIDTSAGIGITLNNSAKPGQVYELMMNGIPGTGVRHTLKCSNLIPIHFPASNIWSATSVEVEAYGIIRAVCANDKNGNAKWWIFRIA